MICCSPLTLRLSVKFYFKLITSDHFNMTTTVEKTAHYKYVYANLMWLQLSTHARTHTRQCSGKKTVRSLCAQRNTPCLNTRCTGTLHCAAALIPSHSSARKSFFIVYVKTQGIWPYVSVRADTHMLLRHTQRRETNV